MLYKNLKLNKNKFIIQNKYNNIGKILLPL